VAISDNNPDRRNLVLLSISIIIFVLAGGEVADDNIRLQVINVHFNKPIILEYFVWIMLVWFTYRYWLGNKGSWKKGFYDEVGDSLNSKICYSHMYKKFGLSDDYTNSYHPDRHWLTLSSDSMGQTVRFQHIYKLESGQQKSEFKEIETLSDRLMMAVCIAVTFVKEPSLSTYFLPYLFTLLAVALGVSKSL
jgi:hypothetical protein